MSTAVMVTPAQTPDEMRRELQVWIERYGKPPGLIVAHEDAPFGLARAPECKRTGENEAGTEWSGIPVVDLGDLWDGNAGQLFNADDPEDSLEHRASKLGPVEDEPPVEHQALTLAVISAVNLARAREWHRGGLIEANGWNAADWSNAMAGEAGEVCNAVKKLRRLEVGITQAAGPQTRAEALLKIAQELGETFLYLDLLAQALGINLEQAIVDTFNRVSVREGFPHRLEPGGHDRAAVLERTLRELVAACVDEHDFCSLCGKDPHASGCAVAAVQELLA